MRGAVAIDFGAGSGRYAAGTLRDGRIEFEIIRQVPHAPYERDGKLYWDLSALRVLCDEAAAFAKERFGQATIGIDTWGVDHGFIDFEGRLIDDPVCYRDLSHLGAFDAMASHRSRLYELTGCQHQPFNTICQLAARKAEDPTLRSRSEWMILPDLLAFLLSGKKNHELTQASTTQLLGLDGKWCEEAFEIAGWPMPANQPEKPGRLGGEVLPGISIAHVGSHDTASAVCGFGSMQAGQAFLNVGTWSLCGVVLDRPIATPEAERLAFTNERTVDGRIRFLRNTPGFYVINRLHEDLGISVPVPDWLENLKDVEERVDLLHPDLYNPKSMAETCASLIGRVPASHAEWAGLALGSLTATIASGLDDLAKVTGIQLKSLRVGGGGSQSDRFCRHLAAETGLKIYAGPAEATVLGNLGMQFLASGQIADFRDLETVLGNQLSREVC